MSKLIEDLKKEQAGILKTLETITSTGISTEEGQQKLFSVKNNVLAYAKRQTEELYKPLKDAVNGNPKLKKAIELYEDGLPENLRIIFGFFDKHPKGGGDAEFFKDFGLFAMAIKKTIVKAQCLLFKEYLTLNT
jgi:hypothetical protein